MVKKIFSILLLVVITDIQSALVFDPGIEQVIEHFMDQNYDAARSELVTILKAEPDNIDALFMHLNADQIEIVDYESYVNHGYRFIRAVDSVLAIIDNKMRICKKGEQARCLFYTGTIYGMKSLVLAKLEEWLKAVKCARTSVKLLEEARDLDTSFNETLYGIGLYNYYLGENLKWLPFMRGKSRKGLADIEKVASSSSPLNFMAKNSLAWIYVEREDYQKADALVSSVLKKYPDNTIFLRIKARVALLKKDYSKAVVLGKRQVVLSQKRKPVNWADLIDAYQIVVASLDAMGKYKECLKVADEAQHQKVPAKAKKIEYVRKHLDYIGIKKNNVKQKM